MMVIGLGGGLVGPTIFSLVASSSSDDDRARNTGVVKGVYYAGPFLGPSVLHLIYPDAPASYSLLTLSALAGTLAIIAFLFAARANRTSAAA